LGGEKDEKDKIVKIEKYKFKNGIFEK